MLTRLIVMISLQYIQIFNHYIVYMKLICHLSVILQLKKSSEGQLEVCVQAFPATRMGPHISDREVNEHLASWNVKTGKNPKSPEPLISRKRNKPAKATNNQPELYSTGSKTPCPQSVSAR